MPEVSRGRAQSQVALVINSNIFDTIELKPNPARVGARFHDEIVLEQLPSIGHRFRRAAIQKIDAGINLLELHPCITADAPLPPVRVIADEVI